MKTKSRWFSTLLLLGTVFMVGDCNSSPGGPKELLDIFFSSAVGGDYVTTYTCYYAEYKEKVSKEEFIKHRKEVSVLQAYKIIDLNQQGDSAHAEVQLTFGPSERLQRKESVTTTVEEDMVKEGGDWKIKVW